MFLSIMILIQNSLPCTENFYRYQKNFEKYISTEDGSTAASEASRPHSGGAKVKTIASPRIMQTSSPVASLAKKHGINFNPKGTTGMLRHAANNPGANNQPAAATETNASGDAMNVG